ncbi:WD repeat-containing protein 49-like [Perognathus longimembris pacificus]|uniref:WD repeat-containing protein 49-like n=1 Tax=Perognathus longimembris pacificus TaxID=214514 RepID=UPI0020196D32|nr:WD repeat-containing protein 49-like [Perognathus longimembris pacificus]
MTRKSDRPNDADVIPIKSVLTGKISHKAPDTPFLGCVNILILASVGELLRNNHKQRDLSTFSVDETSFAEYFFNLWLVGSVDAEPTDVKASEGSFSGDGDTDQRAVEEMVTGVVVSLSSSVTLPSWKIKWNPQIILDWKPCLIVLVHFGMVPHTPDDPHALKSGTWKKMPKVDNMPTITICKALTSPSVNYIRWKVHGDWVTQLNYYDSMKAIISSSNHEPTALVIGCTMGTTNVKQKMREMMHVGKDVKTREGPASSTLPQKRAEWDQTVFHIYKGVKVFSFCKIKNLLLTGGLDRIIRVWNPYLPGKPTGMLRSHTAPVSYIHVSSEDSKILSMSIDNTVKIWDLETHSCLFTASSKASGIKGEFATCLYLPGPRALCVATDAVALLQLRLRSSAEPHLALSHQEPVVCCGYNPTFRHVVSCSEASVVKVWDLDTGTHLSEFIGDHGNAGVTCLTFDSSGRRLVTGGRDGCLKIWSYNNGHCLHTLKHDVKQSEVCDCTYLVVNQNKYVIAVGWDRRINTYFDAPHDFHHFWKPQPPWQDDLNHGHKEDILCVAQCPPFLLATSSYDGEIIIWNVISGHIYCKLHTPSHVDGLEHGEGPDQSISCLTFLKTRAARLDSVAASLMANGPGGSVTFWRLFGEAGLMADFTPSREKTQVSRMAVTAGDTFAYLADHQGFVHIYDIKDYSLQGPELQPPKNVTFWRAHVNTVTSLELIEEENMLLSSSLDCTVCLWSRDGACIGTFGQSRPWDILMPATWSHLRSPDEILTDSQSMAAHPVLEGDAPAGYKGQEGQDNKRETKVHDEIEKICNLHSPEDSIVDDEVKEGMNKQLAFFHSRLQPALNRPRQKVPDPGWPSIYQSLRCHGIDCVSALGEKPDFSMMGSDLFDVNFYPQEEVELSRRSTDPLSEC